MNFMRIYFAKNVIFLALLAGLIGWLFDPLMSVFKTNIVMNAAILGTLFTGISYTFYQLFLLRREQKWFLSFEQGRDRFPGIPKPVILRPLNAFAHGKEANLNIFNRQSLLNSIDARLEELRNLNRYLIGLLIFLGLLGTFWGLSQTIGAIAGVVSGLDVGANDIKEAFEALKVGLQSPLKGMGTAFSSSMFGLGSSLILGFLDLQVGKASQRFYQWLEERMLILSQQQTESTALSHNGMAYSQGMMEQTAENLSAIVQALQYHHENRLNVVRSVQQLTDKLANLADVLVNQKKQLEQMRQNNEQIQEMLRYMAAQSTGNSMAQVAQKLTDHLASVDLNLAHLLEESIQGRQQLSHEVRSEIRMVAKTISALANSQDDAA